MTTTIEIPLNSGIHYSVNYLDREFDIIDIKEEKPDDLLKFYPLSSNSINCLLNHQLYASHPLDLNDPFDNNNQYLKLIGIDFDKWMTFYSQFGIISFAHYENWNNILMWAHYSRHEGFAVAFEHKKLDFKHYAPFPMNYQKDLSNPDLINQLNLLDSKTKLLFEMLYLQTIKHDSWKYEREYRVLATKENFMKCSRFPDFGKEMNPVDRLLSYKQDAVKEIIIGYEFILKSDCYIRDKEDNILLKTIDSKRIDLLTFLSSSHYPCSLIDIHPQRAFELDRYKIRIEKNNETEYKIIRK